MDSEKTPRIPLARYIEGLVYFQRREGHCNPPATHVETLPDGLQVPLGAWTANTRHRYRRGGLSGRWVEVLDSFPGWSWERRLRGRPSKQDRDAQIREMHREGIPVSVLSEQYRVSRQRIHQVVKGR
jgi:hypothetical protein